MDRTRVISSNVRAVGYDAESQVLEVEFKNGSVYDYFDVPEDEYQGLMQADSKGKYLNARIKGTYDYERVL